MEMIMKKALAKKNGKKGFTLVEVIVVLVILAILAAIAIPALTGYIDKANKRAVITEARTIGVALQTTASDAYGEGNTTITGTYATAAVAVPGVTDPASWIAGVNELTSATYTAADITSITFTGNKLTGFKYNNGTFTATLASGKYTVTKNP